MSRRLILFPLVFFPVSQTMRCITWITTSLLVISVGVLDTYPAIVRPRKSVLGVLEVTTPAPALTVPSRHPVRPQVRPPNDLSFHPLTSSHTGGALAARSQQGCLRRKTMSPSPRIQPPPPPQVPRQSLLNPSLACSCVSLFSGPCSPKRSGEAHDMVCLPRI